MTDRSYLRIIEYDFDNPLFFLIGSDAYFLKRFVLAFEYVGRASNLEFIPTRFTTTDVSRNSELLVERRVKQKIDHHWLHVGSRWQTKPRCANET